MLEGFILSGAGHQYSSKLDFAVSAYLGSPQYQNKNISNSFLLHARGIVYLRMLSYVYDVANERGPNNEPTIHQNSHEFDGNPG
jgi:hypothetical protein